MFTRIAQDGGTCFANAGGWWKKNGISGSFGSSRNAAQLAVSSSQKTGMCRRKDILWFDSQCWQDCRSIVLEHLIKERRCITSKDPTAFLMYYKISGMLECLYAIGPWEVENGGQEIASDLLEHALSRISPIYSIFKLSASHLNAHPSRFKFRITFRAYQKSSRKAGFGQSAEGT